MSLGYPVFTCNACVLRFQSSDLQRYHMKTEWHRYNLKRRGAELPPVSADSFAEKLQILEKERAENQVDEFGFRILKPINTPTCNVKARKVISGNSKRVRRMKKEGSKGRGCTPSVLDSTDVSDSESTNTTDYGENTASEYGFTSDSNWESESEIASVTNSEGVDESCKISVTDCIYCGRQNKSIKANVNHMFMTHGLYIPERSYLINLNGLLNLLIQEVVIKKFCLCCSFHGSSLESIRDHMLSKRHCKMPYETKKEREKFAPFYDFSSLSENSVAHREFPKPYPSRKIHFEDQDKKNDNNDEVQSQQQINSNYATVQVDDTGLELTLPNGARVGHRIGQRYFRQNLPFPLEDREGRATVSAADRRLASGVTEKEWKEGMRKMQMDERMAMNQRLRRQISGKVNFQPHYKNEFLQ